MAMGIYDKIFTWGNKVENHVHIGMLGLWWLVILWGALPLVMLVLVVVMWAEQYVINGGAPQLWQARAGARPWAISGWRAVAVVGCDWMSLVVIVGTTTLVPERLVKSLQLIWRSGTRSSNELQWLDQMIGCQLSSASNGHQGDFWHMPAFCFDLSMLSNGLMPQRRQVIA